jgi:hypothetical protein
VTVAKTAFHVITHEVRTAVMVMWLRQTAMPIMPALGLASAEDEVMKFLT